VVRRVFSPDSDGNRDRVTATYRIDERARAVMLVDGRQRVQSKFRAFEGKLVWFGRINGRVVPPGMYEIRLRAVVAPGTARCGRAVLVRVRLFEPPSRRIRRSPGVLGARAHRRDSYGGSFCGTARVGTRQVLVLRAPTSRPVRALSPSAVAARASVSSCRLSGVAPLNPTTPERRAPEPR
jgi:hypothetical protein